MDEDLGLLPRAEPSPPPRLRLSWRDVACVGPIIAHAIYTGPWIGVPLQAVLIGTHPLLLSALRGSVASLVAVGAFARVGQVPIILALIAPVPVSIIADPFYFWAGARYGRRIVNYLSNNDPRWHRRAERSERLFRRYGVWAIVLSPLLPFPQLVYMAAGEAGMSFLLFISADIFASLWFIGAIVAAGWFVGQPAVSVAEVISSYSLWVIIGLVVVIIAWSALSARRAQPR